MFRPRSGLVGLVALVCALGLGIPPDLGGRTPAAEATTRIAQQASTGPATSRASSSPSGADEKLTLYLAPIGFSPALPYRIDSIRPDGSMQIRFQVPEREAAQMARLGLPAVVLSTLVEGYALGLTGMPETEDFVRTMQGIRRGSQKFEGISAIRVQVTEVLEGGKAVIQVGPQAASQLKTGKMLVLMRPPGSSTAQLQAVPGIVAVTGARGDVLGMDPGMAAQLKQSKNNLKQLAVALHNYHDVHKSFPPAYSTDKDGKPLLSWRVQILPYIDQMPLYKEFHLDEPWDSEHNKKLIPKMPRTLQTPGSKAGPGKTNYLGAAGEKGIFPGKNPIGFANIMDGTSNTIMTVEVNDESAVIWTKPDDFVPDPEDPKKGLLGVWNRGFQVGMGDGSVRFLPEGIDNETLGALFTRNGAEPVDRRRLDGSAAGPRRPVPPVPATETAPPGEPAAASPFAVKAKSNEKGDQLTVLSFDPPLPAILSPGEQLKVRFSYTLTSGDTCLIWVRPYTDGKRTPGYGAHGSAQHPKGKGDGEGWFTFTAPARIDQVGVKMVVDEDRSAPALELFVDADARWTGDATATTATNGDRYAVPEGGVEVLLKFIQDLRQFRPRSAQEFAEHRQKAPAALKAAAQKILQLEQDQWTEAYQTALRVMLEDRIRTISSADPSRQRQTVDFVKTFLTAKLEKGIESQDAGLALSAARALEYTDNRGLAAEAYQSYAELIGKSEEEPLPEMAKMMEGAARRLTLLGNEMKLEGTAMDGTPFDWAAYRGKVVLVDFWATWCGPCRAELPNVRENYERYHDRGFEVVGISTDRDREALEKFLEKEQLPWVTLHEKDVEGRHPMAAYYGVMAIPTVLLVDREGKVVSLRARGTELNRLLEELLGPVENQPTLREADPRLASVSLQMLKGAELSASKINGSDNEANQLTKGTILVAKTSQGRYSKLLVQEYGYNLVISWVTYDENGAVHSQGSDLRVRGTWSCDLDLGQEAMDDADFWWEQVDSTERYLVPMNGTLLAIVSKAGEEP